MRTRSFDFSVASSASLACTHEPWLRIFAISKRYLFRPHSRKVSIKIASCVLGVQAATTTRLRFCSLMISFIWSWESWEQVKRFCVTYVTYGKVFAYSSTAATSTTLEILIPQWQTNTPIRGSASFTSISSGRSTVRVRVFRADARHAPAAQAAAEASVTELGISFASWKAPQT